MARYAIGAAARQTPDKPALIVTSPAGRSLHALTYAQLETAVLKVAAFLRGDLHLAKGARVMLRLDNGLTYPLAFFGAVAGGLVPVPASPDLTARELDELTGDADPAAILLDDRLPSGSLPADLKVAAAAEVRDALDTGRAGSYQVTRADDPAFLIYTSGTSARPKGVLHAHRSAWGRRPMYRGWYGLGAGDRVLHAGGLNWTYTIGTGLTDPWACGATAIVCTGEKSPDIWPRLIEAHGVTLFAAVPGIYRQMLALPGWRGALGSLRHGLCAGETLASAVADGWSAHTGLPLYQALGMSELSTYISTGPEVPAKPGTVGKPQPGRCIAILPETGGEEPLPAGEAGLIAAHRTDPGLMLGYWRQRQEEAEVFRGGWFTGGDAGFFDGEGYIVHLGRRNELMNAGGFRVSPVEVEQQLALAPGVADVAVAEVEVRAGVSVIAAFIVPQQGRVPEETALKSFAEQRLARYKQPRAYVFVEALPRTANGKVRRAALKTLVTLDGATR
jgi:acyl-coenzyme A synthetase/AMP-(fatty) acid ligase